MSTSNSLRARSGVKSTALPAASSSSSSSDGGVDHHEHEEEEVAGPGPGPGPATGQLLQRPPSFTQRAVSQTLTGTANLANLLPTGTLLAFQLLTPIFTANGTCDFVTRPLTIVLLSLLAVSCFLASFTDSVRASDGQVYYGFATFKGLYMFDSAATDTSAPKNYLPDLRKYRLTLIDWVHAILSVLVFGSVALRDRNVVSCFYPQPIHEVQEILDIVPVGVGIICGLLFMVFPTRRHGIGYPVTPGSYPVTHGK